MTDHPDTDAFNMSMRKFLKQVGVTSQKAIEDAIRDSGAAGPFRARVVLSIDGLDVRHEVTGEIRAEGGRG